ncbi:MAG: U32 family peptidase [Gammaproteobacteria bacterium]|nr:MAG: U32 family peptidase [Gammaproteobacteria bacterium]
MLELVCPAGSLPALQAALSAGADAVYVGFRNNTNARAFTGLNFNHKQLEQAVATAHRTHRKVFFAINTYAEAGREHTWHDTIDQAIALGTDALIMADPGLLAYAREKYPDARLHLSVQGSATTPEAINLFVREYGIQRAVLPRVLSLKQVKATAQLANAEIEVFGFGSLCIMAEGRCHLSSWLTGESPNTYGVCSPAKYVQWEETNDGALSTRLNRVLIDNYAPGEEAAYPTLCKGRFEVQGNRYHALEEPTSLNTISLLPELYHANVRAIKIEGRQRSPAYVKEVTRIWRQAIDSLLEHPDDFKVQENWQQNLMRLSEGRMTTLGAYHRSWQ